MFLIESPHLGDFNEYTQLTIINIKIFIPNIIMSAAMGPLPGDSRTSSEEP